MEKNKLSPLEWVDQSGISFILGFAITRLFAWNERHEVSSLYQALTNVSYELSRAKSGNKRKILSLQMSSIKEFLSSNSIGVVEDEVLELIISYSITTDFSYLEDAKQLLTDLINELQNHGESNI